MLSYSGGPLPEQQLASFPKDKPVWICYGKNDPWTPPGRVEALIKKPAVEKVVGWEGVGHCPHDEAPEKVNPLLFEFLNRIAQGKTTNESHTKESAVAK
jgi:pimeloyl-ACP methyl ester carboxylesterase